MKRRIRTTRRGFTLVEALATMTILAAMTSVSATIMFTAVDGFTDASITAQMHSEACVALDRLAREMRKIPRDSNVAGVAPKISDVTSTSMDWNDDYSLSLVASDLIYVDNGSPAEVILEGVTAFSIQTYDESNTALAASLSGPATTPIRRIEITVTQQRSGVSGTLRSKIFLRSTMAGSGT